MARCRFVMPGTDRLPLSDGNWIEVKKELNTGEQKHLEAAGVKRQMFGPPQIDWEEYHVGRTAIWLESWGGPGFMVDGRSKDLNVDAIRALDTETFEEIQTALTDHIKRLDELKKARASATTA